MSRGYLDANYLYVHLRQPRRAPDPRVSDWRRRLVAELGDDSAVISALVLDEVLYRMVLAWLGDDGDGDPLSTYRRDAAQVTKSMKPRLTRIWKAIDRLNLELAITDQRVVDRARQLLVRPGLAPRDAFHAAHALEAGCEIIASSDPDFDRVNGLRRLAPR
ncbi:MAG: type II toxin-antitoxin system VapC family toxin [Acidimicrobiia bacterium]